MTIRNLDYWEREARARERHARRQAIRAHALGQQADVACWRKIEDLWRRVRREIQRHRDLEQQLELGPELHELDPLFGPKSRAIKLTIKAYIRAASILELKPRPGSELEKAAEDWIRAALDFSVVLINLELGRRRRVRAAWRRARISVRRAIRHEVTDGFDYEDPPQMHQADAERSLQEDPDWPGETEQDIPGLPEGYAWALDDPELDAQEPVGT